MSDFRVIAAWRDPRATSADIEYRLLASGTDRAIERKERDLAGGARWSLVKKWSANSGNHEELSILALGLEQMAARPTDREQLIDRSSTAWPEPREF